jgi:hypothetical protein
MIFWGMMTELGQMKVSDSSACDRQWIYRDREKGWADRWPTASRILAVLIGHCESLRRWRKSFLPLYLTVNVNPVCTTLTGMRRVTAAYHIHKVKITATSYLIDKHSKKDCNSHSFDIYWLDLSL